MTGPRSNALPKMEAIEVEDQDLTQEIDSLTDFVGGPNEPTLSKLDFEEIELALE